MRAIPQLLAALGAALASHLSPAASLASLDRAQPEPPCMAIGLPSVQGIPGNATEVASGVRELMTTYLNVPSLRLVALDARLPSQQVEESKQKGCDRVLVLSVTRKSGGGGFSKALGAAAGATAGTVPIAGAGASAAVQAAAVGGLRATSTLASSTKSKDELRLEYRVVSPSGQVQFGPRTEKQKANVDGEDLLTPVVSRAAEAIVTGGKG